MFEKEAVKIEMEGHLSFRLRDIDLHKMAQFIWETLYLSDCILVAIIEAIQLQVLFFTVFIPAIVRMRNETMEIAQLYTVTCITDSVR